MPTKLRCIAYHLRTGIRCTRTSKRHPLCRAHRRGLNFLLAFTDEDRARRIAAERWTTIEEFKRRRALRMSLSDAARLEAGLLGHAARFDPRFFTPDHEADDE